MSHAEQAPDAVHQFIDVVHTKGQSDSPVGTEDVYQQGSAVSDHVGEKQGRASALHHAVGYLGDFQFRIDGDIDSLQLARLFEKFHELSHVLEAHYEPVR